MMNEWWTNDERYDELINATAERRFDYRTGYDFPEKDGKIWTPRQMGEWSAAILNCYLGLIVWMTKEWWMNDEWMTNEWWTNDERMMNENRFLPVLYEKRFLPVLYENQTLFDRSSFAHHSLIIRSWWSFVHHSFIVRSSFAHHSLIIQNDDR